MCKKVAVLSSIAVGICRAEEECTGPIVAVITIAAGQIKLAGLMNALIVEANFDSIDVRIAVTVEDTLLFDTETVQAVFAGWTVVVAYA